MKKKRKLKISPILSLIFIISTIYLIFAILQYKDVENMIRYSIIGGLIFIDIIMIILMIISKTKKKKGFAIFTNIIKILFIIIFVFLGFNLNKIMGYFVKVNKVVTYSSAMVTLAENNDTDLSKMEGKKLGIVENTNEIEGYQLAKEIINNHELLKKNTLVTYSDFENLIDALYKKEVDYIFLPAAYEDIYSTKEEYEDIAVRLKTITTTDKETTKEEAELLGSGADITKPFTVLLMGIDSTTQGLKNSDSFNGDTMIVVTFNPTTMTATMLNIHRDSYVPIMCYGDKHENKINSAAARGTNCTIKTIENYIGINIDYYVKINFTGLVDLVDTLGGIEVDVPYALCEQDSKRRFGANMVYIEQGFQTLNGEQALAFSRNRKSNSNFCPEKYTKVYRSVELRGKNQQTVILAILEKLKKFNDITKVYDLLDVISDNVDTNMTKDTILSFYNVAKDMILKSNNDDVIQIQKLNIIGDGQMIYDESSKLVLWYYIPQKQSLQVVKDAMFENLDKKAKTINKTFSFDIDTGYKETIIGEGRFSQGYTYYELLPDLTDYTLTNAQSWATKNGVTLKYNYVKKSGAQNGEIVGMEYPKSKRVDRIPNKTMTIDVVKNDDDKVDCLIDTTNSVCKVPNFVGKTMNAVTTWGKKFSNTVNIKEVEEYTEDEDKVGTILKQSVESGTTIKEMFDDEKTTITFTIGTNKKKEDEGSGNQGTGNQGESGSGESGSGTGTGTGEGSGTGNEGGTTNPGTDNPTPPENPNPDEGEGNNNNEG